MNVEKSVPSAVTLASGVRTAGWTAPEMIRIAPLCSAAIRSASGTRVRVSDVLPAPAGLDTSSSMPTVDMRVASGEAMGMKRKQRR